MKLRTTVKVTHTPLSEIEADIVQELTRAMLLVGTHLNDQIERVVGVRRYSLRELAQLGHPFSRHAGGGGFNPAFVSVQTGEFFRAFEVKQPVYRNRTVSLSVINESEKAELLSGGTSIAIERPFMREITRGLEEKFISTVLHALNKNYQFSIKSKGV